MYWPEDRAGYICQRRAVADGPGTGKTKDNKKCSTALRNVSPKPPPGITAGGGCVSAFSP
jgi:hypothetical protein